jgi:hypothetical protein
MAEVTDVDIDVALERAAALATKTRYDRAFGRVIVDLTNGCTFAFPARLAQGLESATADRLAAAEILGATHDLH